MRRKAIDLFETLQGLVCLYKPPEVNVSYLKFSFSQKIAKELNEADSKIPANYLDIQSKEGSVLINVRPSYLDSRQATGPKYQPCDLTLAVSPIETRTSGVCVVGINCGVGNIKEMMKNCLLKVQHVKGKLGEATRFMYKGEKIVARAKYHHVTKETMDRALNGFQAAHQRKIFSEFGVNIQSQQAYELAVQGMLRQLQGNIPTIYSAKCIEYNPPDFTLEIISMKVTENYLLKFIYDLGLELKTLAHCTGIRCVRYGPFTVANSLLTKECDLVNVKNNMKLCQQLMYEMRKLQGKTSPYLKLISEDSSKGKNNVHIQKTS